MVHISVWCERPYLIGFCYLCNCFNQPITISLQEKTDRKWAEGGWVETLTGRRWVHQPITDKAFFLLLHLLLFSCFIFWWITENVPYSNLGDPRLVCNEALYFLTVLYCPCCHSCIWHLNPFPLSTTGPTEYECSLRKIKWLTENLLNNLTLTGNWLLTSHFYFYMRGGGCQPIHSMKCWHWTNHIYAETLLFFMLCVMTPTCQWSCWV